jgi:hypothetical protein
MATKRTNAATQTQPSEPTQRLGLTLDAQTHMLINAMATLRGCPPAELITDSIWQTVGGWQARERDSVLSIVRARFGRLKRSCGPAVAESVPASEEGRGTPTGSDMLANRLADIQTRAVDAPIGDALASLYGN